MRLLNAISFWLLNKEIKAAYASIRLVEAQEFKQVSSKEKSILIDVRTSREFNRDGLPNAIHINYFDRKFNSKFASFDKDQPICLYCASGGRSASAARKLAKIGFTEIYDLKRGMKGWGG